MDYLRPRFLQELNDEGDIEIRELRWSRQQVLETMDPTAYEDLFGEWVGQEKLAAKDRVRTFLEENGCVDRFRALTSLVEKGNVLPFLGAGMSLASGFKPWGSFLTSLLPDMPHVIDQVSELLAQAQYEEAAQLVHDKVGSDIFAEEIHSRLGSHRAEVAGPVMLLPHVFQREVITTNFDYVLPNVYKQANLPFSRELCGIGLVDAPRRLGDEPHCLLRLHGEADSSHGRVLTRAEYDRAYGNSPTLGEVLQAIAGPRSFLFMGCSLNTDRTHAALAALKAAAHIGASRHYAFLAQPPDEQRAARRAFLGNAEIHPIYYPADDPSGGIEDLLLTLIEGGI